MKARVRLRGAPPLRRHTPAWLPGVRRLGELLKESRPKPEEPASTPKADTEAKR